MNWGLLGLRVGSGVGFFAGILVLSNYSILVGLALALNVSILVVPAVMLFRRRRMVALKVRNWLEMVFGLSAATALVFVIALYYFWLSFLAIVVFAVVNTGYGLIESRGSWGRTSAEFRRLIRNLFAMIFVMAPLLFLAVLVIKSVLSIIGWAVAYEAFAFVIIVKYIRDRRRSRAVP